MTDRRGERKRATLRHSHGITYWTPCEDCGRGHHPDLRCDICPRCYRESTSAPHEWWCPSPENAATLKRWETKIARWMRQAR